MTNEIDFIIIQRYNFLCEQITKYIGSMLYIVCSFGTIMNIITFLRQIYNSRACSLYLLIASLCDLIYLNLDPLTNLIQHGFNSNPILNSLIYCQMKNYFAYVFIITSATLTILASTTQYLLSSDKNTHWSYTHRHIAIRCIKITFFFWFIFAIPIIHCSEHINHLHRNQTLICINSAQQFYCFSVQIIYICLFNGFLPPFIMVIFGLLTYRNVHHLYQRSKRRSMQIQRINQQMISMLILQSIKSIFASIPFSIYNCYWLMTKNSNKSLLIQAKENLIYQFVYLLFSSNYTSFFVYIYSSDIFRHQWIKALKKIRSFLFGKRQKQQQQ